MGILLMILLNYCIPNSPSDTVHYSCENSERDAVRVTDSTVYAELG